MKIKTSKIVLGLMTAVFVAGATNTAVFAAQIDENGMNNESLETVEAAATEETVEEEVIAEEVIAEEVIASEVVADASEADIPEIMEEPAPPITGELSPIFISILRQKV